MTIKMARTESIDYDIDRELKRLRKCFNGKTLERQLLLIKYLLEDRLKELAELYDNLPYNDKNECPEKEYVGSWLGFLFNGDTWILSDSEMNSHKISVEVGSPTNEHLQSRNAALKSIDRSLKQIK
jgi:hypothetical protein